MIVKEIIGNINSYPAAESKTKDWIALENEALAKRVHHLNTSGGEVSVRLAPGKHLHVGDILAETEDSLVVVDVLPEDVLVISPDSINQMGVIAHELGNRHLPAQFIDDTMVVQFDYLIEKLLGDKGIAFERQQIKMLHPFRHIGHSHDH
ncbi:urease accessory protein UreE [Enterococcus sp. AZ109]|uniref:urease accessory protein UreE n=1 Tax=Enterococcus sp. AZ109 TaxID=2774634 RepID=UPI003F28E858